MFQKPYCERFGKKYGFFMFNKMFDQCKGKKYFDFIFVITDLMVRFRCDSFSNDKIASDNLSQETSNQ